MGRAKKFDEDAALAAAMRVFWHKGYRATSVQDLEEATGLKRTSIYNTFGNKRRIFQKTLILYSGQVEELLRQILDQATGSRQAVDAWFKAVIAMHFDENTPGGCLVILSVLESSQHDQATKELAAALFQREKTLVADRLARGVREGELSPDFDCATVAGALSAVSAGLMVLAMANYSRPTLEEIGRAALTLLVAER